MMFSSLPAPKPRLESLPNELLDQILSYLVTEPPSSTRFHATPSAQVVRSETRDLKNFSLVSSRLLATVRPYLFTHVCFDLGYEASVASFIEQWGLARYVVSLVVTVSAPSTRGDPLWWQRVLRYLDPQRILVVAAPQLLGKMLGAEVLETHGWAFDIPLQALQLEKNHRVSDPSLLAPLDPQRNLLSARPWESLSFNESSSLKAYNHYEYFLLNVPSAFDRWAALSSSTSLAAPQDLAAALSLHRLTRFSYTAVFPFYNHVGLVLEVVKMMSSLRSFAVQLAPGRNDNIIEIEQRGSLDPSDPWMELYTGYSLIAHVVRERWHKGHLRRFESRDFAIEALQEELSVILVDVLEQDGWVHDGNGAWSKQSRII
ncbi:hypothetical protein ASPZODRAFT_448168 [Penicilliopsis zonata CBS 506.65]|uniref:F-box domain-containing protein n=1 Tax=Penicilliopsis zonata CBS 506.65 TaxID=1073090 RepID=A0A1L9SX60_9EURO|nr:hypothetical protein ASPZODRAFT_448168 [Penicilliopsis zonata CBS 506.65]OJJ51681.1 hypothetical protein ASPZODRAFT_448168 [Penicilliopsis zonata CBS 506.65]